MSSSQLTFIFFRGIETTNQLFINIFLMMTSFDKHIHLVGEKKHQPNRVLLIIFQSLQSAGSPGWGGFAKSLGEYGSLAARAPFRFSVPCLVSWFPLEMRVYIHRSCDNSDGANMENDAQL